MKQSTTDKPPREAQRHVNREEARMLVAAIGYEQASAKTGIPAPTLRKWNERYKWKVIPTHALAVTNVTKPSDALATVLSERKDKSKLHLSKYVERASYEASEHEKPLAITSKAKDIAAIHQVLWPEREAAGSGVLAPLTVYSGQTVIQVGRGHPCSSAAIAQSTNSVEREQTGLP